MNKDLFVSVILPVCIRSENIEAYVKSVSHVLAEKYENFEILIVDDGHDLSLRARFQNRIRTIAGVRYLRLSRPVGLEIAIGAGFESVIGDICLVLVPEVDPVTNLLPMIELCESSQRIVIGRFLKVKKSIYTALRRLFYFLSENWLDIPIVENATYCVAIHRASLNSILQIREKLRFFRLFVGQIGLEYEIFSYEPTGDSGISYGRGLRASFEFAIDVIVANSLKPLRFASLLTLIAMLGNFAYAIYVLGVILIRGHWSEGWVTLSLIIAGNAAVILAAATATLEYIRTIVLAAKDRPSYFVVEDFNGPLLAEQNQRLNIVNQSVRT